MKNINDQNMVTAVYAGMSALMYVTDPDRWPAFAAFAEQNTPCTWTDADRLRMIEDAKLLYFYAEKGHDNEEE